MDVAYGIGLLLLLIVLGIPVGFALGLAGTLSLLMVAHPAMVTGFLGQVVHHTTANYVLLTIPMFILISEFLSAGGITRDLMIACNRLMWRIRGGLAMASVLAGSILAAASGSSTASVATLAGSAFPTMKKLGYDTGFSIGTISIAGTLAIMIPPSIAFVVYGIITEESIGKLFMAGMVPGILTALGYIVTIAIAVRRRPELAPRVDPATQAEAVDGIQQEGRVWPIVILVVIILGSLYSGIATPTEVGALGAAGALIITLALRRLSPEGFVRAVGNTLRTTAMIVTIIFGAMLFGYFISYTQVTTAMLRWVAEAGLSPSIVMLLVIAFYIVLGMFMDQFAIIVLTVPITYSLMTGLGYDGIWFGVVMVKTAEIGLVTPPMGLNVFIASAATGTNTKKGFSGVVPFLFAEVLILAAIVIFPDLVLFVPNLMR